MIETMKHLDRLFAFWPRPALDNDEIRTYAEAVRGMNPDDVRAAVEAFVFGKLQRNHGFIPVPGELSAHVCIKQREREDHERRMMPVQRLPAPDKPKTTPEERQAMIERLKAEGGGFLIKTMKSQEAAIAAEHRKARDKFILDAFEGDTAALAEWQAQNRAMGIAARQQEQMV